MAKLYRRDRHKETAWRHLLRRWRQSGLSIRAFCTREGVSEPSFYAWRRELARRDAHAQPQPAKPAADQPQRPLFVPLRIQPLHEPELAAPTASNAPANTALHPSTLGQDFELLLADGTRLRLGAHFQAAALQRLLDVLQRPAAPDGTPSRQGGARC